MLEWFYFILWLEYCEQIQVKFASLYVIVVKDWIWNLLLDLLDRT